MVDAILIISLPAAVKVRLPEEEAFRLPADWMVRFPRLVFQVEVEAPVIFNPAEEEMSVELMVMAEPMVAVAVYMLDHLYAEEPKVYAVVVEGKMFPATVRRETRLVVPMPTLPPIKVELP